MQNVIGFPSDRIYYTREEVSKNQKVYSFMESSSPERSKEESFDNERCDNNSYVYYNIDNILIYCFYNKKVQN